MRRCSTVLATVLIWFLALHANDRAHAQIRPAPPVCPTDLGIILGEAREVQTLYAQAEAQDQKPEACARALVYSRLMRRAAAAVRLTPRGCQPSNPQIMAQYYTREQTIWHAKVQRNCLAGTGHRQQQKIIRVTP